jgi:hypothetical protein
MCEKYVILIIKKAITVIFNAVHVLYLKYYAEGYNY